MGLAWGYGCRDFTRYEALCCNIRFVGVPVWIGSWRNVGGAPGATGPQGPPGQRGTQWHFGNGPPPDPLPGDWLPGDVYLDMDSGELWQVTPAGMRRLNTPAPTP